MKHCAAQEDFKVRARALLGGRVKKKKKKKRVHNGTRDPTLFFLHINSINNKYSMSKKKQRKIYKKKRVPVMLL